MDGGKSILKNPGAMYSYNEPEGGLLPKVCVSEDSEEEEPPFPDMAPENVEAAFQCFSDFLASRLLLHDPVQLDLYRSWTTMRLKNSKN